MAQLKDDIEAYLQAHTGTFSCEEIAEAIGSNKTHVSIAMRVLRKWRTVECSKGDRGKNLWEAVKCPDAEKDELP